MITNLNKEEGIKAIQPLFDLWKRGQNEGIIKPICPNMLFAFSLFPIIYIAKVYAKMNDTLSSEAIDAAFGASWDAIRL